MIHLGICDGKKDVHFCGNGIVFVKKRCPNGCPTPEDNKVCDQCGRHLIKNPKASQTCEIMKCKNWCDRLNLVANGLCLKTFDKVGCVFVCQSIVAEIHKFCNFCCGKGTFYKTCIEPYENFLPKVPCDPMWD